MKEVILAALAKLDPAVDSHWTAEGLVNLNSFKFIAGGVSVTREQLEEAAPGFTRTNPVAGELEAQPSDPTQALPSAGTDEGARDTDSLLELVLSETTEFPNTADLSTEQLQQLSEVHLDQIDQLNQARDRYNKMIDKRVAYLRSAHAEFDRRQPKLTIAEMVRMAHEANKGAPADADRPRARPHTTYAPLRIR